MQIQRNIYLNRLIERKDNGMVKVVTGIRRCGKSFLLFELFNDYLLSIGVKEKQIIKIAFDDVNAEEFLDRYKLNSYINSLINDEDNFYILLDEIQFVEGFEKVLNGLNKHSNIDIYVTGSNSKFLSSDILTEFRGRGDEVRVFPLNFSEFVSGFEGSIENAWNEYFTYGGLPLILTRKSDESKSKYLKDLFEKTYLDDVIQRNGLKKENVIETVVDILASSVGSLTNPLNIANTFNSKGNRGITDKTVSNYIDYLRDAFILNKAIRYNVKGRKYVGSPFKYYFTDIGLRNARLNFRQQEENHIMENILFNELIVRGYNVDVGVVEVRKNAKEGSGFKKLEIDFVCNRGNQRYYIQSAFDMSVQQKFIQEQEPLIKTNDSFKKIIVVKENIKAWRNEQGILIMGLKEFLLNRDSLDL